MTKQVIQTKHVKAWNSLKKVLLLPQTSLVFLCDYIKCLCKDSTTISKSSYALMRRIYGLSLGASARVMAKPHEVLHRPKCNNALSRAYADEVRRQGYSLIKSSSRTSGLASLVHNKLREAPVYELLEGFSRGREYASSFEAITSLERRAARLNYHREDVARLTETWDILDACNLHSVASCYLNCDPVLTSVDSWLVVPIPFSDKANSLYSAAAQTFHYDMDWIRFIKFFVSLSDGGIENGPFEYIPFTHKRKHPSYYKDGRFERLRHDEHSAVKAIGPQGTVFVADTAGLHRDGRANAGFRHVLQFEFAISSFGCKYLYNDVFRAASSQIPWSYLEAKGLLRGRMMNLYQHVTD